jgi:hypothetical protein
MSPSFRSSFFFNRLLSDLLSDLGQNSYVAQKESDLRSPFFQKPFKNSVIVDEDRKIGLDHGGG